MFEGEFACSLDEKGRVTLPVKLREIMKEKKLGNKFKLTRGFDKCLALYPLPAWEEFIKTLQGLPQFKNTTRRLVRYFIGPAVECFIDTHGRITLPPRLRQDRNLNGEIIIVGMVERIELWNKKVWEDYLKLTEEECEKIAEEALEEKEMPKIALSDITHSIKFLTQLSKNIKKRK
jgi:MraZ protein